MTRRSSSSKNRIRSISRGSRRTRDSKGRFRSNGGKSKNGM